MTDTAPVEPAPAPAPPVAPPSGHSGPPMFSGPPPQAEPEVELEPEASDPLVDPFDYGQQQFDRRYVEKLRSEAANRRGAQREAEEALAPFRQAFDGLSPDDVQAVLQFSRTLAVDPAAAAEWMVEAGQTMLQRSQQQTFEPYDASGEPDPNDPNRPWTVADQQRWEAEQAYKAQTSQLIAHWNREASRLGYNPNAQPNDPAGPTAWLQFQQLVKMAELTGGNLEAAHNALVEQAQGAASQQLAARAQAVRQMARPGVPPVAPEDNGHEMSSSERWQRMNDQVRERLAGEQIQ